MSRQYHCSESALVLQTTRWRVHSQAQILAQYLGHPECGSYAFASALVDCFGELRVYARQVARGLSLAHAGESPSVSCRNVYINEERATATAYFCNGVRIEVLRGSARARWQSQPNEGSRDRGSVHASVKGMG